MEYNSSMWNNHRRVWQSDACLWPNLPCSVKVTWCFHSDSLWSVDTRNPLSQKVIFPPRLSHFLLRPCWRQKARLSWDNRNLTRHGSKLLVSVKHGGRVYALILLPVCFGNQMLTWLSSDSPRLIGLFLCIQFNYLLFWCRTSAFGQTIIKTPIHINSCTV